MKDYEIKIQEKSNFCLCSVLQAIFRKYEIYFSQEEIAKNLTPSERGFLADDLRIKQFFNHNRFDYIFYRYNETPFNEPDMFLKEMEKHEGIIGINSHAYLLNEFQDPILRIINPENAVITELTLPLIEKEMHQKDGFFGLLKHML